jgi:hypothetical protein
MIAPHALIPVGRGGGAPRGRWPHGPSRLGITLGINAARLAGSAWSSRTANCSRAAQPDSAGRQDDSRYVEGLVRVNRVGGFKSPSDTAKDLVDRSDDPWFSKFLAGSAAPPERGGGLRGEFRYQPGCCGAPPWRRRRCSCPRVLVDQWLRGRPAGPAPGRQREHVRAAPPDVCLLAGGGGRARRRKMLRFAHLSSVPRTTSVECSALTRPGGPVGGGGAWCRRCRSGS